MFGRFLTFIASVAALGGSVACFFWYVDEPECPKSLIK